VYAELVLDIRRGLDAAGVEGVRGGVGMYPTGPLYTVADIFLGATGKPRSANRCGFGRQGSYVAGEVVDSLAGGSSTRVGGPVSLRE